VAVKTVTKVKKKKHNIDHGFCKNISDITNCDDNNSTYFFRNQLITLITGGSNDTEIKFRLSFEYIFFFYIQIENSYF